MTKQPSYRFVGYTEPWAEKKLGEVTDRYDNLRVPVSANARISGNIPYYGANGIQDFVNGYTHDGEFILIAEDGASDLKDYPVQYVNGKVWVNNHAHVIQGKDDLIKNIFLLFAVKRINIEPFLVGGGRAKLNSDVMMKLPLHLPSLHEQTAIGSFFQDIDQLISLQQRKLEVLKEQKKTYLKLLFPAKGQTKPALRFVGFEDEWKEVKLGEVFKISSGFTGDSSLHSGSYKLTRIETISDGLINVKKLGYSNVAPDDSYKLRIGEILFSNINSIEHIGKVALYDKDYGLYHGINLLRLQPIDVNGIFSFYELGTIEKRNWARSHANKAVNQASINQTILSSLNLQIPSLPEQEAIGSFFQDLDKAIAKQEEKVSQLKESKQTLLRKMFI